MTYPTRRRVGVVLAVAAVLLSGTTAAEAAKPSRYRASTLIYENCGAAASVCDASATAMRSGAHQADGTVEVPSRTPELQHWAIGMAKGATTEQLAAPARSVTLTFRWQVDEASSRAEAALGEGIAVGRIFLRGSVTHLNCDGCVVEDATDGHGTKIADSFDDGTIPLPTTATHAPGEVTHTVVLRGPDEASVPAGRIELSWATKSVAYVGCPIKGSDCIPGLSDPSFAGSATAHVKARLLGVTVESAA